MKFNNDLKTTVFGVIGAIILIIVGLGKVTAEEGQEIQGLIETALGAIIGLIGWFTNKKDEAEKDDE